MTATHPEIEDIVREVIRRLQGSPPSACAQGETAEATAPETRAAGQAEPEIRQRVISLATLDGHLDHSRSLRIPHGAILTPSARDELRRRGIQVNYLEASAGPRAEQTDVLLATWQTGYCPRALLEALHGEGYPITQLDTPDGLRSAVEAVASASPDTRRLGVLLTDKPSLAVCLSNRTARVRSAWGVDPHSVTEAVSSIAVNLLILEPTRHRLPALADMARTFLRGGGGGCPDALKQ